MQERDIGLSKVLLCILTTTNNCLQRVGLWPLLVRVSLCRIYVSSDILKNVDTMFGVSYSKFYDLPHHNSIRILTKDFHLFLSVRFLRYKIFERLYAFWSYTDIVLRASDWRFSLHKKIQLYCLSTLKRGTYESRDFFSNIFKVKVATSEINV